jgi:hypothetical protein
MVELDAVPAGAGRFRLVGTAPSGTNLQFNRGEIVDCTITELPNGSHGLVATYSVSADPEFRKRRTVYAVLGAIVGWIPGSALVLSVPSTRVEAMEGPYLIVGALLGSVVFSFCSWRWGDAAWEALGSFFRRH